jgi:hypothetical protein
VDLVDALAALHARYHGAVGLPAAIPRVTPAWWQALCRDWVDPRLREHAARHPPQTIARARMLISRVGPAALDLANLVTADSADVERYARTWQRFTGQQLPGEATDLGYRWAALQIPVQYLPWTIAHLTTGNVEAALDRIERALSRL